MRKTTKQVGESYRHEAERGGSPLWRGAALDVVNICSRYHRARARKMLYARAEEFKRMAISSTYLGAARQLED